MNMTLEAHQFPPSGEPGDLFVNWKYTIKHCREEKALWLYIHFLVVVCFNSFIC